MTFTQKIMPCNGGMVQLGMTGMSNTIYKTEHRNCVSPYQDEKYGKGNRVHNALGGKNEGKHRCTVCGYGYGIVRP